MTKDESKCLCGVKDCPGHPINERGEAHIPNHRHGYIIVHGLPKSRDLQPALGQNGESMSD